jgi:hypothetical protein
MSGSVPRDDIVYWQNYLATLDLVKAAYLALPPKQRDTAGLKDLSNAAANANKYSA